jgi:hypothetical protein
MTSKLDMKSVKEEALEEIREEKVEEAKKKLKVKMREVDNARIIYENLQRELDDLMKEIEDGNA